MILFSMLFAGVTVALPIEARAGGLELTVGAIADVRGDDPLAVERVRSIAIGYAPAPGYSRLVAAARLREQISALSLGLDVTVSGADACRVWPKTESIAASSLERAAHDALAQQLAALGHADAMIEPSEPIGAIDVPAGMKPCELRAAPNDNALRTGIVQVPVRVLVDGEPYRTVYTSWRVRTWADAAVLARPVRAGETITESMIARRRVAIEGTAPRTPLSQRMLSGAAAARDLEAGRALSEVDVLRPMIVNRGDSLQLTVTKGATTVRTRAIALQTGALGDRIAISLADGKELKAEIVARDQAEILIASQPTRNR